MNLKSFKVHPNPVSEKLHFSFPERNEERRISIFNALGQKVYCSDAIGLNKSIEVGKLQEKGFTLVSVITGESVYDLKIIIK